jgi:CRISPR-associated protein Cas2
MRRARMRYLVAYDVSDDGNRLRLANLLLDQGDRVQKSVFEAEMTREELQEFLARAAKYLQEEDCLRAYPLCERCRREIACLGKQPDPAPEGLLIV